MTNWNVEQRVAAGVAFMNENDPGWEASIDLTRLDISDPCDCIFGQRYGGYGKGLKRYGLGFFGMRAVELGLSLPIESQNEAEFAALTAAWREAIAARRPAQRELVTA